MTTDKPSQSALDALLPCPFCGGEVELMPDNSYGDCGIGCGCDAEPFVMRKVGQEAEAITAWNTRAEQRGHAQCAAERAALVAEVGRLRDYIAYSDAQAALSPPRFCPTCGRAKDHSGLQICSDGFHAEGPVYWPVDDTPPRVREADPDEATGCADDRLPGSAEQWRAAAEPFARFSYRVREADEQQEDVE